jgi:DNA-binding transcriptional regulator YiaG
MNSTEKPTQTRSFEVFLPPYEGGEPELVETIQVEVFQDDDGDEVLTPESSALIDRVHARHRGLLSGSEIRRMRERLNLTQKRLAALLGCGEKTLSRLENGDGYPSLLVNRILRLLDEGFLSPPSLEAVMGPRGKNASYTPTMPGFESIANRAPMRRVGEMMISKSLLFRRPLDDFPDASIALLNVSEEFEFYIP